MLGLKASLLADVGADSAVPSCALRPVCADLTHDLPSALQDVGLNPSRPICWLIEGLTAYLTAAEVDLLLDRITAFQRREATCSSTSSANPCWITPLYSPCFESFAEHGMAWIFGTEEPEELLTEGGWQAQVTSVGAIGTELGRWPFPMLPAEPRGCRRITLSARGGDLTPHLG